MTYAYKLPDGPEYQPVSAPIDFSQVAPTTATTQAAYKPQPVQSDIFSDYELYNFSDWDGCDAEPISAETIAAARRLLRLLPRSAAATAEVAPGGNGTIGFQWTIGSGLDRIVKYIEVGPGHIAKASTFADGRTTKRWPTRALSIGVYNFVPALFPHHESA
jgi:hypothetical protein